MKRKKIEMMLELVMLEPRWRYLGGEFLWRLFRCGNDGSDLVLRLGLQ